MKLFATALFAGFMTIGTAACAKEEPKQAPVQVAQADAKKESAAPAPAQPETKRVCVDVQGRDGKPVMDAKTGKPKQNCTTVKIRPKFEGTKIDEVKKK
jgi:hypothetical protein